MKHMFRLNKNNKGVTLVEVIAVIAVLGVVMAAVTGFMISGTKMSAKVSDEATGSMKEQTASEFINRRIWAADDINIDTADPEKTIEIDSKTYYTELTVGQATISSVPAEGQTGDMVVQYKNGESNAVILCTGNIYFEEIEGNMVTYYLNGTKHVVHLRKS